ncbi:Nuclear transport factor 2 family protein [Perilla frutescens var. hirtella]|uniref:Nuclear transport factor 2 family protein n=1 Tax=Perilla frutescens var. hirtella TaxID=608512 RepID=A0AAD4PCD6_PERFH|nr:Nuclear transport factor 2 family protein [Perilla frutescens var. hirtella]
MMIRSIPTVHFYPSHLETDHLQTSAITTPSTNHNFLRDATSRDYGSAAFSAARGGSIRSVLRRSNPAAAEAASATAVELDSAATTVRKFYDGINRRDLASVEDLIALNCVYEDLIFSQPFTGRKAILDFFKQFIDSISADLQFAIDDISEEDTSAVGVSWHLEWKGKPFPFSRGCSFYRLDVINCQRQIVFGRDAVEPAIKPGETALVAIRGVTWLLQNFPFLGDRL